MTTQIKMDKDDYTALFKCTRCGQCSYGKEDAGFNILCPVHKKGHFFTYSAGGMMQIARNMYEGKIENPETIKDIAYLCTFCGVCEVNCGVIENHGEVIAKIRNFLMDMDCSESAALSKVISQVVENKNPYGYPQSKRVAWLPEKVMDLDRMDADIVYFVGCVSAYDQKQVPRAFASIMSKLGIACTVFSEEHCCGAPLFFSGKQDEARRLAMHNIEIMVQAGQKIMVTSCPTCALMIKKYYPVWTGKALPFKVVHTMEYLDELMDQGKLILGSLNKKTSMIYHDSCHLGRGLGIYDAPRRLLGAIDGVDLKSFELSGENSACCGGGGMVPVLNPGFSLETAVERLGTIPEASSENRITELVSACPNCRKTLGLAARRSGKGIKVSDVCEVILSSMSS